MKITNAASLIALGYILRIKETEKLNSKSASYSYHNDNNNDISIQRTLKKVICNKIKFLIDGYVDNRLENTRKHLRTKDLLTIRSSDDNSVEAERIISKLREFIAMYGQASIADLCSIRHIVTYNYDDCCYGWTHLYDYEVCISNTGDACQIKLPPIKKLH
mgnify:CR=1 FL=1